MQISFLSFLNVFEAQTGGGLYAEYQITGFNFPE